MSTEFMSLSEDVSSPMRRSRDSILAIQTTSSSNNWTLIQATTSLKGHTSSESSYSVVPTSSPANPRRSVSLAPSGGFNRLASKSTFSIASQPPSSLTNDQDPSICNQLAPALPMNARRYSDCGRSMLAPPKPRACGQSFDGHVHTTTFLSPPSPINGPPRRDSSINSQLIMASPRTSFVVRSNVNRTRTSNICGRTMGVLIILQVLHPNLCISCMIIYYL